MKASIQSSSYKIPPFLRSFEKPKNPSREPTDCLLVDHSFESLIARRAGLAERRGARSVNCQITAAAQCQLVPCWPEVQPFPLARLYPSGFHVSYHHPSTGILAPLFP